MELQTDIAAPLPFIKELGLDILLLQTTDYLVIFAKLSLTQLSVM